MAEPDFWIREAVRIGKWFKENCQPCQICGELTCDRPLHTEMHNQTNGRFQTLEDRVTAAEGRLTALENPPA